MWESAVSLSGNDGVLHQVFLLMCIVRPHGERNAVRDLALSGSCHLWSVSPVLTIGLFLVENCTRHSGLKCLQNDESHLTIFLQFCNRCGLDVL